MPRQKQNVLRLPAVRLEQNTSHPLYLFSLTSDQLFAIADISRVSRDEVGNLVGYQRPEVRSHVQDIVDYLKSENVVFPNPIILAVSSRTKFRRISGPGGSVNSSACGMLEIPVPILSEAKPAWIVDGQQRALALSKSGRQDLPIPVNAFVTDDVELQRDQFIRINNTKPLPNDLLRELLPSVSTSLPSKLEVQRVPSVLCDQLNRDPESPFYGLIHRASTAETERREAVVAALSVVKMIQESLFSPWGCLFTFHNLATGETDYAAIHHVLCTYWKGVKNSFAEAWGLPPTQSRLMHGAGIRAMGRLMDRVMSRIDPNTPGAVEAVQQELSHVLPVCSWTSGRWESLGDLPWNKIQNMSGDISLLSDLLIRTYEEGATTRP